MPRLAVPVGSLGPQAWILSRSGVRAFRMTGVMSERPEGSYEAVVVDSTAKYLAYLVEVRRQTLSGALRSAINHLVTSLAAAMTKRRGLVPSDVPFTTRSLKGLSGAERELLVNQWSLGVGNPSAPVIVMGTEHAYDVNGDWPAGLAVESCANAILWLADDRGPLAAHIEDDRTWTSARDRGYHRHPYDTTGSAVAIPGGWLPRWRAPASIAWVTRPTKSSEARPLPGPLLGASHRRPSGEPCFSSCSPARQRGYSCCMGMRSSPDRNGRS